MLYVVREATNEILWRDDAFDTECMNKAKDFITYEGHAFIKTEVTFSGDMVIWVK